jgi:hypothetical protein
MQKLSAVALCGALIFLGGWAFGQTNRNGTDGAHWKALNTFEKGLYTAGFSRGHDQGFTEAAGAAMVSQRQSQPVLTPELKEKASKLAAQARDHAFIGNATVGQIVATVDTFYSDYRNMEVCWNDAVLLSSVSLAGRAPAKESLDAARKNDAESGCN